MRATRWFFTQFLVFMQWSEEHYVSQWRFRLYLSWLTPTPQGLFNTWVVVVLVGILVLSGSCSYLMDLVVRLFTQLNFSFKLSTMKCSAKKQQPWKHLRFHDNRTNKTNEGLVMWWDAHWMDLTACGFLNKIELLNIYNNIIYTVL